MRALGGINRGVFNPARFLNPAQLSGGCLTVNRIRNWSIEAYVQPVILLHRDAFPMTPRV